MDIIKCNICKLNPETCDDVCIDMEDKKSLYREGKTLEGTMKEFCTNHSCPKNPTGFRCSVEKCIYGFGEKKEEL